MTRNLLESSSDNVINIYEKISYIIKITEGLA